MSAQRIGASHEFDTARLRHLRTAARAMLIAWTVLPATVVAGGLGKVFVDLDWAPTNPAAILETPTLLVFGLAPLSTLIVTGFAQAARPERRMPPFLMFLAAMTFPFIVSALVFSGLDEAFTETKRPPRPTRGALLALSPVALFIASVAAASIAGAQALVVPILFVLFVLSRITWAGLTVRACSDVLIRDEADAMRAHHSAPVGGG